MRHYSFDPFAHRPEEIRVEADIPLLDAHNLIIKTWHDALRAVRWTGEVALAKC